MTLSPMRAKVGMGKASGFAFLLILCGTAGCGGTGSRGTAEEGATGHELDADLASAWLDERSPLFVEALAMSQRLDPSVDADVCLWAFMELVGDVQRELEAAGIHQPDVHNRDQIIGILNRHVLADRGVTYLSNRYWRDSLFTAPLLKGQGNCLATSLLYHLVAEELNLPLGIQFLPGHALVGWHGPGNPLYIETTKRGMIIGRERILKQFDLTEFVIQRYDFLKPLEQERVLFFLYHDWAHILTSLGQETEAQELLAKAHTSYSKDALSRSQEPVDLFSWETIRNTLGTVHNVLEGLDDPSVVAQRASMYAYYLESKREIDAAIDVLRAHYLDAPKRERVDMIEQLGKLYRHKRIWGRAINLHRMQTELDPGEDSFNSFGAVLAEAHRDQEAIEAFETALKYNPESTFTRVMLAGLYERIGEKDNGRALFARITEPRANKLEWYGALVWYYAVIGEEAKMLVNMQKALEEDDSYYTYRYFVREPDLDPYRDRRAFKKLMEKHAPSDEQARL